MFACRVGFIGSASGERFALPGLACDDNQWAVPVSVFQAKDVVGQCMFQLECSNVASVTEHLQYFL